MPLTTDQKAQIGRASRDQATAALRHLTGAKSAGNLDHPDVRELEEALNSRLTQLDSLDNSQRVSKAIEEALAIINGQTQPDPITPRQ